MELSFIDAAFNVKVHCVLCVIYIVWDRYRVFMHTNNIFLSFGIFVWSIPFDGYQASTGVFNM